MYVLQKMMNKNVLLVTIVIIEETIQNAQSALKEHTKILILELDAKFVVLDIIVIRIHLLSIIV